MNGTGDQPRPPGRAAFAFVFVTVFLDMLTIGIIIPVLPTLVVGFVGGTARAAEWLGIFSASWALMQFVFSPIQGSLSDRFGRRPVIVASNVGLGLDYILMALAPSLWWLFAGRLINGITAASISTSFAYVADVTKPDERAKVMGYLGVAMGSGFVIGPALGGVLGALDPRLPFWLAAGLSLANALYGYFVLPESLPRDRRAPFTWRRANPVGALRLVLRSKSLAGLAWVNFMSHVAHCVLPSVSVLYLGYRYGWDERMVGLTMAVVGVGHMIVQGALIGPMVKRFGEPACLTAGLLFGGASFIVMGAATSGYVYWLAIPLMSLWGLAGAALNGLMTQLVEPTEQGQLQGANMSAMGIGNMIGPLVFAALFAWAIGPMQSLGQPGLPFYVAGLLLLSNVAVGIVATRGLQRAA